MNIFGKIALTGLALSLSTFASAAGVTGTTDFRVTLPEVLVLYHWDDVLLNLSNDNKNTVVNDVTTRNGSAVLGDATTTVGTSPVTTANTGALATSIAVTLKDAWAVRNLSTGTGVTLTLTNPNPTLLSVADKTSLLTTTGAALTSLDTTKVTGSGGEVLTIKSGWTPVLGDITFSLDLSKAESAGEYNTRGLAGVAANTPVGNGTDTFKLTLTGK